MDRTARLLLAESAERIYEVTRPALPFKDPSEAIWDRAAWEQTEAAGFPLAMVSEERSGFALASADALQVVRIAARHAVAVPLAETMVSNWLADMCGLQPAAGISTIAISDPTAPLRLEKAEGGWRLSGSCPRVPYGRCASSVLVAVNGPEGEAVCFVEPDGWRANEFVNVAGEPRDDLFFDALLPLDRVIARPGAIGNFMAAGAAVRAVQIAGALGRVLDMTVRYATERVQFGRAIGKFQAIQQNVALLAATVAAATAAGDIASEAFGSEMDLLSVAAAKSRAGEAAGSGAAIAHQVHGAIGFTFEHPLHLSTRKLWAWRDEFGNEAWWNRHLGEHLIAGGADNLWPSITKLGMPQ